MKKNFYITTTLPYVNADPHIGFALEIIQADALARSMSLLGYDVLFNTGTDEHGLKIYRKAQEMGVDPQTYCDEYAAKFHALKESLNLTYTNFIRTTDEHHKKAAQEFWNRCKAHGDIYKKIYQVNYCVGCELEKTDSELVDGRCPLHPTQKIEHIDEENYFFRFSKYQQPLLDLYNSNPSFVQPASKMTEIKNFVQKGLEDFSISRLKEKMPWGVPVPDDEDHVMYVWFDALVNYISTLGWPRDMQQFEQWWPGVQVAGKDNLRQQSAMWQAMLMSAHIGPSQQIFIHGFITSNGQKMSKSVGNVVNPLDLVNKYGTDAVRYYLLREIPSLDDGDFSCARMDQLYNSDLANELGNLLSRITTIAAKDGIEITETQELTEAELEQLQQSLTAFAFNQYLEGIWSKVKDMNKQVNEHEPWKKTPDERRDFIVQCLYTLQKIGILLTPFMPETAEKISQASSGTITKIEPLFPRLK